MANAEQYDNRPIGIFDSGLGGLTVFKAVHELLPCENLIYFGDTAHVPYGSKSAETVTAYSLEIARFLAEKNIKLLVVACNTASALALEALQKELSAPVIGVIHSGAAAALKQTCNGRIGVIGTEATVKSHAYRCTIQQLNRTAQVFELACPLFVPLVEEGWWQKEVTLLTAKEYLKQFEGTLVDTVILGCTHYPVIKPVIQKAAGKGILLIDSASAVAAEAACLLKEKSALRKCGAGETAVYVSDDPVRFKKLATNILGKPLEQVRLKKFS